MRKLLIVDDNADLLFAMQRLLSFYNFTVRTLQNSKTLPGEIASFRPEVILIDVLLSGEDGRRICKDLRNDQRNSEITLILFSASPGHLINFHEYGADQAIEKPFGVKDLIEKIEGAIVLRREFISKMSRKF
jgi:DNA-binding response OmpR family regulator